MHKRIEAGLLGLMLLGAMGCGHLGQAQTETGASVRVSRLPFLAGTPYKVLSTTSEQWDFGVPNGTLVLAMDAGRVQAVREKSGVSGCDVKFRADSQFILVKNDDGTTTRYEHLDPLVRVGQRVRRGDRIATTSQNGFQCQPMLSVRTATAKDAAIQLEFEEAPPEGQPRMAPTS